MSESTRLFELLPETYRSLDEANGKPLKALLGLVTSSADLLHEDISNLWRNFFIETCDRWVIPYVGELVGNKRLNDVQRPGDPDLAAQLFTDLVGRDLRPPVTVRLRADVAKTVYYRRRKGTLPMLEEMARDVTGWPVHAVEFFQLLGWTQFVRNHLRMHSLRTPNVRSIEAMDRLNGPFDHISHTVDVRPLGSLEGWYNIHNIGFFIWRLLALPITNGQARQSAVDWGYHFSQLGNPARLFSAWRREGDESGLATELHVPGPIRQPFFYKDLKDYAAAGPDRGDSTNLYGMFDPMDGVDAEDSPEASIFVLVDGEPVKPALDSKAPPDNFQPGLICANLDPWPPAQPTGKVVAVDVVAGRLALGSGFQDVGDVDVWYHTGFPAHMGGGPYERGKWLVREDLAELVIHVRQDGAGGAVATLGEALQQWAGEGKPNTVITILDNRTYTDPIDLELADDRWLVVQSANGTRPHLVSPIQLSGDHPGSKLTLSGLLIEGWVEVAGELSELRLLHSTLVPGRALDEQGGPVSIDPSIFVQGSLDGVAKNAGLRVELAFSITGPIRLPEHSEGLWLLDSIVDGLKVRAVDSSSEVGAGPCTTVERSTVHGSAHLKRLDYASESIFTDMLTVVQKQQGCMRFCFVPRGSATPRRYRCQPDLHTRSQIELAEEQAAASGQTLTATQRESLRTEIAGWLKPTFTSIRYGWPAYTQLHLSCPGHIATGAEDGSEMGAFSHLKQPQRLGNLRIRLGEYLPFGLDPGFIYVT